MLWNTKLLCVIRFEFLPMSGAGLSVELLIILSKFRKWKFFYA